ncbi:WUSCHEL-related homeobox 6-like [Cryptomeria japonica]|uniref:WUSCHEL-related homeobox 6-like n=1 Tax=Cryptomeria japonica TaxID=3369 RepID=UPI0027DA83F8|nr:WUSCHEL-related homeobox 6-like [Cryptomeria japonica]
MRSDFSRWKPTEIQKSVLNSKFASGTRNQSLEEINHITAELQRHGLVEGKNVFFWFQNAACRDKQKKEKAESCDRWKEEKAVSYDDFSEQQVHGARIDDFQEMMAPVLPHK